MTTKRKADRYAELMGVFLPRPIRNDKDMAHVQSVVDELLEKGKLAKDERDYLQVLGALIEAYEEEQGEIPDVSEAAMLAHLIDARCVTQRAVAEGAGVPETTISDLLAGRRELNRGHIEKLAAYFNVSPAVFFKMQEREPASQRPLIISGS